MDIKTVRWQKARQLVEREGGISRFAERVGRTQQQANQFAGPNPTKGIGNKIARLIEQSFGLAHGYLDKMEPEGSIDLSAPASNSVEAIRQASQAAERYVFARSQWQQAQPRALDMVRSDFRNILIGKGLDIVKEPDKSYIIDLFDAPFRIDLFLPLPGFDMYRYQTPRSLELPDVLAIPICQSSSDLSFYLIPKSVIESLPDNRAIRCDVPGFLNGVDISEYLNNWSVLP